MSSISMKMGIYYNQPSTKSKNERKGSFALIDFHEDNKCNELNKLN